MTTPEKTLDGTTSSSDTRLNLLDVLNAISSGSAEALHKLVGPMLSQLPLDQQRVFLDYIASDVAHSDISSKRPQD